MFGNCLRTYLKIINFKISAKVYIYIKRSVNRRRKLSMFCVTLIDSLAACRGISHNGSTLHARISKYNWQVIKITRTLALCKAILSIITVHEYDYYITFVVPMELSIYIFCLVSLLPFNIKKKKTIRISTLTLNKSNYMGSRKSS